MAQTMRFRIHVLKTWDSLPPGFPIKSTKTGDGLVEALERSTTGHQLASGLSNFCLNCNPKVRPSPPISGKTYFLFATMFLYSKPIFSEVDLNVLKSLHVLAAGTGKWARR